MSKKDDFSNIDTTFELKKIGMRLKQVRKELGYSSHETFAYSHGLDRAQYGKYEAGSSNITLGTLIRILNVTKITLSQFFNDEYDALTSEVIINK